MKLLILLVACLAVGSQAYKSYAGYKTYRITPLDADQLYLLQLLHKSGDYDFWKESNGIGKSTDVMVSPSKLSFFNNFLINNKFQAEIMIDDVEKTIPGDEAVALRFFESPDGSISFDRFERYDTITSYLQTLADKYPNTVSMFSMGKTYEGRNHVGVKISSGGSGKPAIFVDGGIHAREWLAPCQALYIINQLAENPANANMFKNVDWYIVPVLNPDGYEYTHTADRFWRKTRSQGKRCKGTDPNRNFGFHWNEVGTSNDECSDIYAGSKAFSEIETINLKNFASKIPNIKLYLTFHAYGNYMLYPWGWTTGYPTNRQELHSLASAANDAVKSVRGTTYTIGSSTNVLYPAAGGSDDWMMGALNVPLSYTIELPEGGSQGFDPPAREIKGVVNEMWEGVKVFARYISLRYGQ